MLEISGMAELSPYQSVPNQTGEDSPGGDDKDDPHPSKSSLSPPPFC